jgi:hypothetical protein
MSSTYTYAFSASKGSGSTAFLSNGWSTYDPLFGSYSYDNAQQRTVYVGGESTAGYGGEWAQMVTPWPVRPTGYYVGAGQCTGWRVLASNDGASWTLLHSFDLPLAQAYLPGENNYFGIDTAATYLYFRLVVASITNGSGWVTWGNLSLYGYPPDPLPTVTPTPTPTVTPTPAPTSTPTPTPFPTSTPTPSTWAYGGIAEVNGVDAANNWGTGGDAANASWFWVYPGEKPARLGVGSTFRIQNSSGAWTGYTSVTNMFTMTTANSPGNGKLQVNLSSAIYVEPYRTTLYDIM